MNDKEMDFYAHTDGSPDGKNWQPLKEHLKNTANLVYDSVPKIVGG